MVGQVRLRLATHEHVADLRGPNLCAVITPEQVEAVTSRLGPDPLRPEPDPELAWRKISRSSKPIAELLMDQAVLAGIGNVYRSEVLFRQRVDPFRPGTEIRRTTWDAIWLDLVDLLPLGVATGKIVTVEDQVEAGRAAVAAGPRSRARRAPLLVYKRTGEPCRVCGSRSGPRSSQGATCSGAARLPATALTRARRRRDGRGRGGPGGTMGEVADLATTTCSGG